MEKEIVDFCFPIHKHFSFTCAIFQEVEKKINLRVQIFRIDILNWKKLWEVGGNFQYYKYIIFWDNGN